MVYVMTGVREGTLYKTKFYEASVYKLSSVSLQICVNFFYLFFSFFIFFFFFCNEYHFYLNYLDRQACANSVGPNQMLLNSK